MLLIEGKDFVTQGKRGSSLVEIIETLLSQEALLGNSAGDSATTTVKSYETATGLLLKRLTVSGWATRQLMGGKPRRRSSTSLTTMFPISVNAS